MRVRVRAAAGCLGAVLLLVAPLAHAQPDLREQARRHFAQGVALFDSGDHEGALSEFEEAQRLRPHPRILRNIAASHEALQHYLEAIATLELFVADPQTTAAERRQGEAHLRSLRGLLGGLELSVQPDGAAVLVDDRQVGTSPLAEPVSVAAGQVHVLVRREGYRSQERDVRVVAGGVVRETFTLQQLTARLHLDSNAEDARASVGDRAPQPLPASLELLPGTHSVRTEAPGYLPSTAQVALQPEEDRTLTVVLERPPATVRFDVAPPGARVLVDGELRAQGGRHVLHLEGGLHRVRLEGEDLVPWEDELQLRHGGEHRLHARLGRDRLWVRPAWFWTGVVATAGLSAAAIIAGVRVLMLQNEHIWEHTNEQWRSILDERRSLAGVVDALWLGAAAAALSTTLLYLLSRGEPPDPQIDWE